MERRRVPKIVTCHHGDLEWTLRLSKNSVFPKFSPHRGFGTLLVLSPGHRREAGSFHPWARAGKGRA